MRISGNRCLVLGGAGFIGRNLVESLVAQGIEVVVYDRKIAIDNFLLDFPGYTAVCGDFETEERWSSLLDGVDVCYHLISTSMPQSSNNDPVMDISGNLIGTLRLLNILKNKDVRLVFSSSGGTVYGIPRDGVVSETHPTDPLCSYGISKLAIEKYLYLYRELYGVRSVSLRIANPYGPMQKPNSNQGVIAVFAGRILRGLPVNIWGDGSVVRDYIYINDVVRALQAGAGYEGKELIFNIGSGYGCSVIDILHAIESASDKRADVVFHPSRGFDVPKSVLDITRASRELRWNPSVPLEEGLRLTILWLNEYLSLDNKN